MGKSILTQLKDNIVELMALLVSISALLYAILQGNTQEKLEIVNKQPLLVIEFNKTDFLDTKGFLLTNAGFGPAIIESFRYSINEQEFKNKKFHTEWLDSTRYAKALFLGLNFKHVNVLEPGFVIKNDRELYLLGTIEKKPFYGTQTEKSMSNAIIEIWYTSISPLDKNRYYLRYCENFKKNNVRDSTAINEYEAGVKNIESDKTSTKN